MHPCLEMHLYICISSIYDNNVVVLPLFICIMCHMALSPLPISCRQQSKQLGSHGHMLLGKDLDSNKSLFILESFKVVNLLKNDEQLY